MCPVDKVEAAARVTEEMVEAGRSSTALIEAAIDRARATKTWAGYDQTSLLRLGLDVITNWKNVRACLTAALAAEPAWRGMDRYLIWSNEHRAWWRPNRSGYTIFVEKAGRYSQAEAIEQSRHRDQSKNEAPPEIPVREADMIAALTYLPSPPEPTR